jgi:hypothetical protein
MMKNLLWRLSVMAAFAAVTWSGSTTAVLAAEEERGGPGDRLERLERRVNEMAERQEQFMRRLGDQQDRQAPAGLPGRGRMRPPGPMPGWEGMRQQGPMPGVGNAPQPMPPTAAPAAGAPPFPGAPNALKKIADLMKLCFLLGLIFNILTAVWISADIRKRGEGSRILVVLALLAGIPTAIIYALVRIGDKRP